MSPEMPASQHLGTEVVQDPMAYFQQPHPCGQRFSWSQSSTQTCMQGGGRRGESAAPAQAVPMESWTDSPGPGSHLTLSTPPRPSAPLWK